LPATVHRCEEVDLRALRELSDALEGDVLRCMPATDVATPFLARRLRIVSHVLRGAPAETIAAVVDAAASSSAPPSPKSPSAPRPATDVELDAAVDGLVSKLAAAAPDGSTSPRPTPETLDSEKVQELLRAVIRFVDFRRTAARVSHPGLAAFLRVVLGPLVCLKGALPSSG